MHPLSPYLTAGVLTQKEHLFNYKAPWGVVQTHEPVEELAIKSRVLWLHTRNYHNLRCYDIKGAMKLQSSPNSAGWLRWNWKVILGYNLKVGVERREGFLDLQSKFLFMQFTKRLLSYQNQCHLLQYGVHSSQHHSANSIMKNKPFHIQSLNWFQACINNS